MLNKLYKLGVPETGRDDLVAVLGTGHPEGDLHGQRPSRTSCGSTCRSRRPGGASRTGWACSAATTPASRTAAGSADDVVDIEEQAVAGFLKGKKVPLGDGVNANDMAYLGHFPYVPTPHQGYANAKATEVGRTASDEGPPSRRGPAPLLRPT